MTRRPSPLEQMRRLADDGMEPWQIAAALGVREQAVLTALGETARPGGAVRAVEAQASVVPSAEVEIHKSESGALASPQVSASDPVEKPDTPVVGAGSDETPQETSAAPRYGTPESATRGQQGVQALRDRIRALGITPAQLRDWAADAGVPCPANGQVPGRVVDAWEAANAVAPDGLEPGAQVEVIPVTYPAADETHPADVTPLAATPSLAEQAMLAGAPWPLALEAAASLALDRDPEYGTHVVEDTARVQDEDDDEQPEPDHGASCTAVTPSPEPEHVHDPFAAWRENGIPYATCECGEIWERALCEACPAIVSALHVATFGPRHKNCVNKPAIERTNP